MYSEGGFGFLFFFVMNILFEFIYRNLNYDRVYFYFFGRCMLKNCMKLKEVLGIFYFFFYLYMWFWDFEDR